MHRRHNAKALTKLHSEHLVLSLTVVLFLAREGMLGSAAAEPSERESLRYLSKTLASIPTAASCCAKRTRCPWSFKSLICWRRHAALMQAYLTRQYRKSAARSSPARCRSIHALHACNDAVLQSMALQS